ncbi:glycosyltransferase [Parabacteroides pacaensis]|uniref:glycosyltransferase n=1 Tax=Parabacteroides pacaensis TaxID=2086575 RepID=UPI000D0E9BF0|nr:glycosyltransferase [Parabacteroides pacaensis]
MKLIVYQRILPKYRYELLKELSEIECFDKIKVIAAPGMLNGAQKTYTHIENSSDLCIEVVKCLSFMYKGRRRNTYIPFYPHKYGECIHYDVLLVEGTTNIFNNIFIIPLAKLFGKKVIWWDSGYSEKERSRVRKCKDFILSFFIKMTDAQMAYSKQAHQYLVNYMGARNCFFNLNTIATTYFENRYRLYKSFIEKKVDTLSTSINLLYVGAIEERKKLKELIDKLAPLCKLYKIKFTIIGNGKYTEELYKCKESSPVELTILPAIYTYSLLEEYYKEAHLFILPGEGGLAIIQSIQFGVPVMTIRADGTELDYIDNHVNGFIYEDIEQITEGIVHFVRLKKEKQIEMYNNTLKKAAQITSSNWIKKLTVSVAEL